MGFLIYVVYIDGKAIFYRKYVERLRAILIEKQQGDIRDCLVSRLS